YFFFQAEDGIRDPLVTGVQTCALPISTGISKTNRRALEANRSTAEAADVGGGKEKVGRRVGGGVAKESNRCHDQTRCPCRIQMEIGRASCRERVSRWGVARTAEKTIKR